MVHDYDAKYPFANVLMNVGLFSPQPAASPGESIDNDVSSNPQATKRKGVAGHLDETPTKLPRLAPPTIDFDPASDCKEADLLA
jgi:hypothetical protein